MPPPLNLSDVEQHFGHDKHFPDVSKIMNHVKNGVPGKTYNHSSDPARALRVEYENHSTKDSHGPIMGELVDNLKKKTHPSCITKKTKSRRITRKGHSCLAAWSGPRKETKV